jgi:hypothetical protein
VKVKNTIMHWKLRITITQNQRMARLDEFCVKQTKLNEGENDGEGA